MIDGRILEADFNFEDYCEQHKIKDPFRYGSEASRQEKNEFLRLEHEFRVWEFHYWMEWEEFQKWLEWYKIEGYFPCDCGGRQCSMECAYFLRKCPRQEGELKSPIKGLEGRYEPKSVRYYWSI